MDKVHYDTEQSRNGRISITPCTRRKGFAYTVGTGGCMACSYCYDVNRDEQYVVCRKKVK